MSAAEPTPRTDAAVVSAAFIDREMDHYTHKFVLADVARELERERNALAADRSALIEALRDLENAASFAPLMDNNGADAANLRLAISDARIILKQHGQPGA